jgi:hypothetical protein
MGTLGEEIQNSINLLEKNSHTTASELLKRILWYYNLECECTVRDGSNPKCPVHQECCPTCGFSPSSQ